MAEATTMALAMMEGATTEASMTTVAATKAIVGEVAPDTIGSGVCRCAQRKGRPEHRGFYTHHQGKYPSESHSEKSCARRRHI